MRSRPSIIVLCCLLLAAIRVVNGQNQVTNSELPCEEIIMHLGRNIAITGETIRFKAYSLVDGKLEGNLSKILYVEIFDEAEKVVFQDKYKLTQNTSSGSIKIPEDATSKYYYLKAYTNYMRNFPITSFHYQQITIVNPSIEGGRIETSGISKKAANPKTGDKLDYQKGSVKSIKISTAKDQYQAREKIVFTVESGATNAHSLSASVRLAGLGNRPSSDVLIQNKWLINSCFEDPFCRQERAPTLGLQASLDEGKKLEDNGPSKIEELQWLPETKGLTVSGLVQNKKQEIVKGSLTYASLVQDEPLLHVTNTDDKGRFVFVLHDAVGPKDLFIGTTDADHKVLIRNNFDSSIPGVVAMPLQYDTSVHHLLESLHLHQQLKNTYPSNSKRSIYKSHSINDAWTNLLAPDRRIVLDEYVDIPTMKEVFREVIPGIQVQKVDGQESLNIFNLDQERYYRNPLTLLDNVPVFNIDEVLKISPSMVEAVEVFQSNYILGDHMIGGIISIVTNTDNFAGYNFGESAAFSAFKGLAEPDAFDQVWYDKESHYPDFTPVVYWQPNFTLDESSSVTEVEFYAPDLPGSYEILLEGYTKEGAPCLGYLKIEVVNEFAENEEKSTERD